jgi:hypothetical protein
MERRESPQERYDRENTIRVTLKLVKNTDADIIDYLEKSGNKQGTIKRLIREEMARK